MAIQPGTLLPLLDFTLTGGVARSSVHGLTFTPVGGVGTGIMLPVAAIITTLPPVTAGTPVIVTVVGGNPNVPLRRAWIDVVLPGIIASEVVHNGSRFGTFYSNNVNTRVSIVDGLGRAGYLYTILRDGGWPAGSFPLAASFTINAVDTIGNGT